MSAHFKLINRLPSKEEIREITDECIARDNIPFSSSSDWRAVAESADFKVFKIDTLPDMFALLTLEGDPFILDREDLSAQIGDDFAAQIFDA